MKRIVFMVTVALVMALSGPASATIHPIVESFDCANEQANAHHPLGDVAEVPGQTPGYGSHSDTSSLQALGDANTSAFSDFKVNGTCGAGA
jgi:hypothetical protein